MRKVTDNELDKIFRDAADRNEPEFDPKDWEDMAKRLDQDDKAALSRSKTLYTVVALLVISSLWPQFNGKDKTQTFFHPDLNIPLGKLEVKGPGGPI